MYAASFSGFVLFPSLSLENRAASHSKSSRRSSSEGGQPTTGLDAVRLRLARALVLCEPPGAASVRAAPLVGGTELTLRSLPANANRERYLATPQGRLDSISALSPVPMHPEEISLLESVATGRPEFHRAHSWCLSNAYPEHRLVDYSLLHFEELDNWHVEGGSNFNQVLERGVPDPPLDAA